MDQTTCTCGHEKARHSWLPQQGRFPAIDGICLTCRYGEIEPACIRYVLNDAAAAAVQMAAAEAKGMARRLL